MTTFTAMGQMNLGTVMPAWERLDKQLIPLWKGVDAIYAADTSTLSARRFDEAQPGGERTYMQASSLISVALDNLGTLRHLITTRGATIWAPWTLLRSVFESAAWVNWLLEPDDGAERRRRGVRRAVLDQKEWRNFMIEFTKKDPAQFAEMDERDTRISAVYREEAVACGLPWETARQKVDLTQELSKLAAVKAALAGDTPGDPAIVVGLWRSMSGMTHGYAYAAQNNSDVRASIDIPGGKRVTYTIKDTSFEVHALMSTTLLVSAMGTYIRRTQDTS